MQWRGRRESGNVDDQRGSSGGGGFGGLPVKGGLGLIAIVIIFGLITGQNPLTLLQEIPSDNQSVAIDTPYEASPEEEELTHFVKVVLADTEDVWHDLMPSYRNPTLVLFTSEVQSGCGTASSSTGPFYCSEDEKLYIDLSFYKELREQFDAPGDFAQAYVIAHEVGHHVQHLLGIVEKVHEQQANLSEEEYNKLSVRLELQADFLAGVWANHANALSNIVEAGDFEEAINAASAIGDDRLQKQFQGQVTPDSFTHGTSAQRVRWFSKGFKSGDLKEGDTFNVEEGDL